MVLMFVSRRAAASCVTPNASRKSSTARSRRDFASLRNSTDCVSGMRHAAAK
ncbi:hypothetical protein BC477_14725 [Clavibacter michiganensis subsp. michiganensis]|uniref:Uncharacterized protein n=1 Tax=Clavibacter michiganensis subsp. michiganensis TaxID=33013 RepID=A0A251XEK0_CLAMM|nr:hypothetical protein BC477_14725 [Clavibacter michiganensis subsp. michiganensis]OUE00653.1 hypothetical protein CMMCAS07_17275 [Clavibacter michiganensis subsp. michiganensis]